MRKLAFEYAGFEMPTVRRVSLEKENSNLSFATWGEKNTVYKGSSGTFADLPTPQNAVASDMSAFEEAASSPAVSSTDA